MRQYVKKTVRFLDRCEDKFIRMVCIVLTIIGFYAVYDGYLVYSDATDNSILKYKPGYNDMESTEMDKEIQGNMVAWLSIDDSSIDYPIMQGETNSDYLNTNPYGEYSLSGSIFLDFRNSFDFSDKYSLIYGHHMSGDVMFGELDNYLDESYFKKHTAGELIVNDETYCISVFAVLETDAKNSAIFAPTSVSVNKTWSYLVKHAKYWNEDVISKTLKYNKSTKLIALSTCSKPDTDGRTIVFGTLSK